MKTSNTPKMRLICIIITLILALISSVIVYFVRGNYYSSFISTDAKVTDIEFLNNYPEKYAMFRFHRSRNISSDVTHRIYYSFSLGGKVYGGTHNFYERTDNYPSKYRVGDTIEIWYYPKAPDISFFKKPAPGLEVFVPYFLAAPVIVCIASQKNKSNRRALYRE